LVIKDFGNETIYRGQTNEALIRAFRANPLNPEILYIDSDLSDSEMAGLYRSSDLLVSSYRGEGFNLPVLEAMATGLPVIVTEGGSTDDFCDKEFSWKINSSKKSVGNQIYGMETQVEAWLLEPSEEHLSLLLLDAFSSPKKRKKKGISARKRAEKHTWGNTVRHVLNQLITLCDISKL
jgi:glycosyltransferase involved in cell wall biosynthesis